MSDERDTARYAAALYQAAKNEAARDKAAKDNAKREKAARECVNTMITELLRQFTIVSCFLETYWHVQTNRGKNANQMRSLNMRLPQEIQKQFHKFADKLVSGQEKKFGRNERLMDCAYELKSAITDVTSLRNLNSVDFSGQIIGNPRFVTLAEFDTIKEKWKQTVSFYDFDVI